MASKNLYLNIVFRCFLIAFFSLLTGLLIFQYQYYVLSAISFLLIVGFLIGLIHYLNKTNAKIAYFFDAIRNEDSSLSFPKRSGNRILDQLYRSLEKLNNMMQKLLIEQLQQEQYFQAILEQVPIGVITFNENGMIFLANRASRYLLSYEHLNHIRQLERTDLQLYNTIKNIRPGDRKLVRIHRTKGDVQLSLKSILFKTAEDNLQLVTIQDIKSELEKTEQESWIKLIRVLTHEIMNTVAPITSMSEILLKSFTDLEGTIISEKTINSTVKGLEMINDQGKGLISFVESYRKLTRLPDPVMKPIPVKKIFEKIVTLINTDPIINSIPVKTNVSPSDLEIIADEKQISQVLVNLCKNSLEALIHSNNGSIELKGFINNQGRPQLIVSDNGTGIPEENLDKIFIPFFTTKESGSGVGLSLSRQIMQMHGGSLIANSVPGKRTSMIMVF